MILGVETHLKIRLEPEIVDPHVFLMFGSLRGKNVAPDDSFDECYNK